MKKIFLTLAAAALSLCAFAQEDEAQKAAIAAAEELSAAAEEAEPAAKPRYWTDALGVSLGANWTNLNNWAAGGYNTTTLNANVDASANYAKEMMTWNNRLQLDYGFLSSEDKKGILQKNNDRIYLESKWAYKTASDSKFSYTASFDFRSQFTDTPAEYVLNGSKWESKGLKSGFISPAYTNIALGILWVPTNWFDINIAPLTGGYTLVSNPILRQTYGMPLCEGSTTEYKSALFQFGAQVKANLKFVINENLKFESQLVAFTDYLNEPYVRVNWDNAIDWQLSKLIKLSFKTWMIYDPLVVIIAEDGTTSPRGAQWKEFLSFNFTYNFNWKK
ncbi:MAG: DUF3078 domain-containing protein [Bacteroidales bacterium]|nr:DUF3078 domain-containing protein [Candidatus Cryptobacteroides aphodequi]